MEIQLLHLQNQLFSVVKVSIQFEYLEIQGLLQNLYFKETPKILKVYWESLEYINTANPKQHWPSRLYLYVILCLTSSNVLPFYVTAETGSVESTLLQISDAMKTNLMNMKIEMNLL